MSNTEPTEPSAWTVNVVRSAQKQLDRLPPHDFDRVDAAIEAMRVDPFAGDVLKLTHAAAGYRKRVGSYRVLFDAFHERRHVDVVAVLRRTSTTYKRRR